MSSFEVVDSLPPGRSNRHNDMIDEFMAANMRYVKVLDTEGIRTGALTLIARQKELPIKVHSLKGDIYLERTDWNEGVGPHANE